MKKPHNIDEYIAHFPEATQERLQQIRATINEAAPEATEMISYQMPTFKFHYILVHFAAFKEHISFFPTPSAIVKFNDELSDFETSKGTIKFPNDQPIPYALITKMVKFRLKENLQRAKKRYIT